MRREYIEKLRKEYVQKLFEAVDSHAGGGNWGRQAMKALFVLAQKKGQDNFVTLGEIEQATGARYGLPRWDSSGILDRKERPRAYRIRDEFYEDVGKVLSC